MNTGGLNCLRLAVLLLLVIGTGCTAGGAGRLPSEKEKEDLRVYFREEWNKRFIECEDWFYTSSETPSTVYLGLQTTPEEWVYEWKPATPTEDGRKVAVRCMIFIKSRMSTVHTGGSWLRPFKRESGYLVAADINFALPTAMTPEERHDFLEAQCARYQTCVGLDVIRYTDGTGEVVDGAKYWSDLHRPRDCGEIPR